MKSFQKFYPHILSILGFIVVALLYFYPTLQGKKIYQSDIVQYTGMAKEQNDFRKETKTEPYWTNSAFGGMPTYQLGANYPNNYIKNLDTVLRFLPRPADYLFLYFIGFYVLLLVLKIDPLKAFVGALAFGFSTYLIIILGVGHNAKAHAIAYMPVVVAGVLLVFQRNYIWGGLLTMVAMALEINANHFQMTYYLLLLLLIISGYYGYQCIIEKTYKQFVYAILAFFTAGILAIAVNATNLMATSEYAKESTRSKSELTFDPDGNPTTSNNAMSYDYITEYSYGIAESLNLIAPRLFGGSNHEDLGRDSHLYSFVASRVENPQDAESFVKNAPTYWGDQPIVAAPAYIGIVVFFFFILALFVEKRKIKYLFLIGTIFSLLLSWGKNFEILTTLFLNFIPLYNKFRAVSSIQVILELCIPALAIVGLHSFFKSDQQTQIKALWKSTAGCLGLILFLFIIKGFFNFSGANDDYYANVYGIDFMNALKADRETLYTSDLLRSGALILIVSAVLWFYTKNRISQTFTVILVALFMILDLVFIDKNYVNAKSFVNAIKVDKPFEPTQVDLQILKDTSHYRVFDVNDGLSGARASYFHKSIGGYHAAKPRRVQQLFDYQLYKGNMRVLNMLNVKYIIQTNKKGQTVFSPNFEANGNAWFIQNIDFVNTADNEMKALDSLNTTTTAIVNQKEFGNFIKNTSFATDSLSKISLVTYQPNYLKYKSNNTNNGIGVFSEIYYQKGWNAYIDGQKTPIFRANYILRAIEIPSGKHNIEFKFEPEVIRTGSRIALAGFVGILVLFITALYWEFKKRKKTIS